MQRAGTTPAWAQVNMIHLLPGKAVALVCNFIVGLAIVCQPHIVTKALPTAS